MTITKINDLGMLHDAMTQPGLDTVPTKKTGDRKRAAAKKSTRIRNAPMMAAVVAELRVTKNALDHAELVDRMPKAKPLVGISLKKDNVEVNQVGFEEWEVHTRVLVGQPFVPVIITGMKSTLQKCLAQGYAVGEFSHSLQLVGNHFVLTVTLTVNDASDESTHFVRIAKVKDICDRTTQSMPIHHLPTTYLTLVEREIEADQSSDQLLAA